MPNDVSWPRLRAILDEAVTSERGISVRYQTWTQAEAVRGQMYKIRDMLRRKSRATYPDPTDPNHGISPYDGLVFWLRSSVPRKSQQVLFHDGTPVPTYPEPTTKRQENEDLYPGREVTVSLKDGTIVQNAHSYKEAWDIIRRDYPCDLILENGYSLNGLEISQL